MPRGSPAVLLHTSFRRRLVALVALVAENAAFVEALGVAPTTSGQVDPERVEQLG